MNAILSLLHPLDRYSQPPHPKPLTRLNRAIAVLQCPKPLLNIKNEKSAQRGSFWDGYPADIRGSFARISWPKTSVRGTQNAGKTSTWARTSMTRRRGRPRPQGTSKNFGQKNFGLNFRSLKQARNKKRDRGRDCRPPPRPRLNSQPQGGKVYVCQNQPYCLRYATHKLQESFGSPNPKEQPKVQQLLPLTVSPLKDNLSSTEAGATTGWRPGGDSFSWYRDVLFGVSRFFDLLFGIEIFLTSNLQDVEAQKSMHQLILAL